jgi:hypothetical protein
MTGYTPPAGLLIAPSGQSGPDEGDSVPIVLPPNPAALDLEQLSQHLDGPAVAPCGVLRVDDPKTDRTLQAVSRSYLLPDLKRRREQGEEAATYLPLQQMLVVIQVGDEQEEAGHKVFLNEEVEVTGDVSLKYGGVAKGEAIRAGELHHVHSLSFPAVEDGDGYLWVRHEPKGYAVYFNFLPTSEELDVEEEIKEHLAEIIREGMASEFLRGLYAGALEEPESTREAMANDGWFPSPALLPQPWRDMWDTYDDDDSARAAELAIEVVDENTLDQMLANWEQEEPFQSDLPFLKRGVWHYKDEDYISSVAVLLPRLEGLTNRALKAAGGTAKERLADAYANVGKAATGATRDRWIGRQLRERMDEAVEGFLMARFDPNAPDAEDTLGRHAHAHGATKAERYDQAYALKILLAIDSLFFILNR